MKPIEIAAQIISIVAMAFNILSYQQKNQRTVICFHLVGSGLFAISFFMLGAIVGGLLNVVAVVRSIIFLFKEKLRADRIEWLIGFILIYIASYVLSFTSFGKEPTAVNFILEFLPVIGMTATTFSYRMQDAKAIRKFGLICSPSWLIYNIANFSIGAIICEIFSLASIIIGIIRLDLKKSQKVSAND